MRESEFRALFEQVSNWGRWSERPERGALNHLTPERVAAAARLVRSGVTVTLSLPLDTEARIDNPEPADHHMTMLTDEDIGSGSVRFAKDYIGVDYHNEGHSHIDAFSHVAYDGLFYDGKPEESVTAQGAESGAIDILRDGLVGRGVLLDIPRLRGVPWLEPGEHVFTEDLEAAEREQGVRVGPGDILLVRTGPRAPPRRAAAVGHAQGQGRPASRPRRPSWRSGASRRSGPTATTTPPRAPPRASASRSTSWRSTRWASTCSTTCSSRTSSGNARREQRWEFLFVAAPLRIARGTGSPLNPIAIF